MDPNHSYCDYVRLHPHDIINKNYHDTQYGFPIESDDELFGRLLLEINQAGLSWTTILKKQDNFHKAYSHFNISTIASYTEKDITRLLNDAGIIRNRRKIDAAIHNAQVILSLQQEFGSFKNWLDCHHPLPINDWIRLFKKTFKFTGKEITKEFLMSTGYIKGAHTNSCPIYEQILLHNPKWLE